MRPLELTSNRCAKSAGSTAFWMKDISLGIPRPRSVRSPFLHLYAKNEMQVNGILPPRQCSAKLPSMPLNFSGRPCNTAADSCKTISQNVPLGLSAALKLKEVVLPFAFLSRLLNFSRMFSGSAFHAKVWEIGCTTHPRLLLRSWWKPRTVGGLGDFDVVHVCLCRSSCLDTHSCLRISTLYAGGAKHSCRSSADPQWNTHTEQCPGVVGPVQLPHARVFGHRAELQPALWESLPKRKSRQGRFQRSTGRAASYGRPS